MSDKRADIELWIKLRSDVSGGKQVDRALLDNQKRVLALLDEFRRFGTVGGEQINKIVDRLEQSNLAYDKQATYVKGLEDRYQHLSANVGETDEHVGRLAIELLNAQQALEKVDAESREVAESFDRIIQAAPEQLFDRLVKRLNETRSELKLEIETVELLRSTWAAFPDDSRDFDLEKETMEAINRVISQQVTEIHDLIDSLRAVEPYVEGVTTDFSQLEAQLDAIGYHIHFGEDLVDDIEDVGSSAEKATGQVDRLASSVEKASAAQYDDPNEAFAAAAAADRDFGYDEMGDEAGRATEKVEALGEAVQATAQSVDELGDATGTTNQDVDKLEEKIDAVGDAANESVAPVQKLEKTFGNTGGEVEVLRDLMRGMGSDIREIGGAASDVKKLEERIGEARAKFDLLNNGTIKLKGSLKSLIQSGDATVESIGAMRDRVNQAERAEFAQITTVRELIGEHRQWQVGTRNVTGEYEGLSRQLERAEKHIDGVTNAEKLQSQALENLAGKAGLAAEKIDGLSSDVKNLGAKLTSWGEKISQGVATKGVDLLSDALLRAKDMAIDFARESLTAFWDFDREARQALTLSGIKSPEVLGQIKRDSLLLNAELMRTSDETLPALYQAYSLSTDDDNIIADMELASKAARAGAADLTQTVEAGLGSLNAFVGSNLTLTDIYDQQFKLIDRGKVQMSEFGTEYGDLANAAGEAGVPIDEMNAALALMTRQGQSFGESAEQIKLLIMQLGNESTTQAAAFQQAWGGSFRDFIANGGTLVEALDLIEKEADATGQSFGEFFAGNSPFFRDQQAVTAALGLTGEKLEDFREETRIFKEEATGSLEEASAIMAESAENAALAWQAAVDNLKIATGEYLASADVAAGAISSITLDMNRRSGTQALILDEIISGALADAKSVEEAFYAVVEMVNKLAFADTSFTGADEQAIKASRESLIELAGSYEEYMLTINQLPEYVQTKLIVNEHDYDQSKRRIAMMREDLERIEAHEYAVQWELRRAQTSGSRGGGSGGAAAIEKEIRDEIARAEANLANGFTIDIDLSKADIVAAGSSDFGYGIAEAFTNAVVKDGDTVQIETPFSVLPTDVRIVGIDTPEIAHAWGEVSMPYGDEATAFTTEFFLDPDVMFLDSGRTGAYGRKIGDFIDSTGRLLSEELASAGLALSLPIDLTEDEAQNYIDLISDAANAQRGMFEDKRIADAWFEALAKGFDLSTEDIATMINQFGQLDSTIRSLAQPQLSNDAISRLDALIRPSGGGGSQKKRIDFEAELAQLKKDNAAEIEKLELAAIEESKSAELAAAEEIEQAQLAAAAEVKAEKIEAADEIKKVKLAATDEIKEVELAAASEVEAVELAAVDEVADARLSTESEISAARAEGLAEIATKEDELAAARLTALRKYNAERNAAFLNAADRILSEDEYDRDADARQQLNDLADADADPETLREAAIALGVLNEEQARAAELDAQREEAQVALNQALADGTIDADEYADAFERINKQVAAGQDVDLGGLVDIPSADEYVADATAVEAQAVIDARAEMAANIAAIEKQSAADILAINTQMATDILAINTQMATDVAAINTQTETDILAINTQMATDIAAINTQMVADRTAINTQMATDIAAINTQSAADILAIQEKVPIAQAKIAADLATAMEAANTALETQTTQLADRVKAEMEGVGGAVRDVGESYEEQAVKSLLAKAAQEETLEAQLRAFDAAYDLAVQTGILTREQADNEIATLRMDGAINDLIESQGFAKLAADEQKTAIYLLREGYVQTKDQAILLAQHINEDLLAAFYAAREKGLGVRDAANEAGIKLSEIPTDVQVALGIEVAGDEALNAAKGNVDNLDGRSITTTVTINTHENVTTTHNDQAPDPNADPNDPKAHYALGGLTAPEPHLAMIAEYGPEFVVNNPSLREYTAALGDDFFEDLHRMPPHSLFAKYADVLFDEKQPILNGGFTSPHPHLAFDLNNSEPDAQIDIDKYMEAFGQEFFDGLRTLPIEAMVAQYSDMVFGDLMGGYQESYMPSSAAEIMPAGIVPAATGATNNVSIGGDKFVINSPRAAQLALAQRKRHRWQKEQEIYG